MDILQKCPLFSGFTGEEIRILLQHSGGRLCKIKKGEKIPAGYLGLLLSGRLCIKGQAADHKEINLNRILPGAAFGAAGLFLEQPELSSIYAEIASEVFLIGAPETWALMDTSPTFRKNYIMFLCGRIAFLSKKIETLSGYTAESRLLAYLQQNQQGGQVQVQSFSSLAGILGISRASLYRAMDALLAAGQIERQGGQIFLKEES